MATQPATGWHVSNKYSADVACEHCEGVVRHETWCITRSREVLYAYGAVLDARTLSAGDELILHALGVKWCDNKCK
jgi:beta-galactosidase GanA